MDLIDFCALQVEDIEEQNYYFNQNDTNNFTVGFTNFLINRKKICDRLWIEELVSWLVPMLFAIFVILGVIGNVLVLIVISFYQQMRNTTNILILNLAVSDLLLLTICIPPTAVDYAVGWPFGKGLCIFVQYLIHVSVYGSVYTLVLLSLDRYLAVVYPVQSITIRTVCNAFIVICLTWIIAFTSCSPIFILFHTKSVSSMKSNEERNVCTFNRDEYSQAVEVSYQTIFFITSLVIPVTAIISLYISMLTRLWRGSAATHGSGPARDKRSVGQENKRRVTRMIIFVIIVFVICWSPLQIVLLLKSVKLYEIDQTSLVAFQIICHCLAYCNSCLNPFLYAFFSSNFRETFKKSIFCKWNRNLGGGSPQCNTNKFNTARLTRTIDARNLMKDERNIIEGTNENLELKTM